MRQAIAGGTRNAKAGLRQLLVLAALAPLLMIIQPSCVDARLARTLLHPCAIVLRLCTQIWTD